MDRPTNDIVQRDILRMSACQILFFDRVPDSAAVNEGVKLAHQLGMGAASGFLNAVLRNLVRQKDQIAWPSREDDVEQYLHVMGSMPMWLVEKLISVYGSATAEEIIMHEKAEHSMVLRPNMLKLSDEEFASLLSQKDWHWKRGIAPHAFLVSGASDIENDSDYQKGLYSRTRPIQHPGGGSCTGEARYAYT